MTKQRARKVLAIEAQAIKRLINRIDHNFLKAVQIICKSKGRVVVTGMGKAGLVGQKISATLSSVGTPSLWLHSAEAIHGDLGRVTKNDVVILLSNSGETDEVKRLLPLLKKIGAKIIALTGQLKSWPNTAMSASMFQ
jgi:arabinose-5-phosphate isomerase